MAKIISNLLLFAIFVFLALAYLGKIPGLESLQTQIDQKIHQITYKPPAAIAALADQAQMSSTARNIFYQAEPVIDTDRATFERDCQTPVSSNVVELGCYTGDDHIYILQIQDPSLQSEMVVVAAHEMLHAAYAQLSSEDKSAVDQEIETEVIKLHSAALAKEIQTYRLTEPDQRDNELHSLLGTEYYPLDQTMEDYYSKFFTNRQALVADHQKFQAVFDNLQGQLNNLESQIRADRSTMNGYLRIGNIRGYNSLVPVINSLIDQYNQVADKYNTLSRSLAGSESQTTTQ